MHFILAITLYSFIFGVKSFPLGGGAGLGGGAKASSPAPPVAPGTTIIPYTNRNATNSGKSSGGSGGGGCGLGCQIAFSVIGGLIVLLLVITCMATYIVKKKRRQQRNAPPAYSHDPQGGPSYLLGLHEDTPYNQYEEAKKFCDQNPLHRNIIHFEQERIGMAPTKPTWQTSEGLKHGVECVTHSSTEWTITSSPKTPVLALHTSFAMPRSFTYEVHIEKLKPKAVVAIGLVKLPYPMWRMPGWHRHSVALFSDDGRKFYDDSFGGNDYASKIKQGDLIRLQFDQNIGAVTYHHNGINLGRAFTGVLMDLNEYPIFGCLGIRGQVKLKVRLIES